jgi:hypothetical protein
MYVFAFFDFVASTRNKEVRLEGKDGYYLPKKRGV